jgi:hypothetical protein
LTVAKELDGNSRIFDVLKENAKKNSTADNTFLFIANPTKLKEIEMIQLSIKLKEEIASKLGHSNEIELMFSKPSQAPFYTTILDFSTKEKLELYRLPSGAENLTKPDSPYLIFRTNEHNLSRIFVRSLLRNVSSVLAVPDRFSTIK